MLFTFLLFIACADRCLGFLLSLSAWFQLQVFAEVVGMFAGQVCTFSRLWGFAEKLFLFINWNLLAWNQLDFIPELYFFFTPWIIAGAAF